MQGSNELDDALEVSSQVPGFLMNSHFSVINYLMWGISKSPVLKGRRFLIDGLQIRRNALAVLESFSPAGNHPVIESFF